jgi:hypothetical protein
MFSVLKTTRLPKKGEEKKRKGRKGSSVIN